MDLQRVNQEFFHSTINDVEENNFLNPEELNDILPDSTEPFRSLRRMLIDSRNRSNKIIQNLSEKLIQVNNQNNELLKELIELKEKNYELEQKINARVPLNENCESLQTPVNSCSFQEDISFPELVLESNKETPTRSLCKSESSPAIMTNVKRKKEPRLRKEFRLFNKTPSLMSLFKKPKKEQKQKVKRLSSSMAEDLRVFDNNS